MDGLALRNRVVSTTKAYFSLPSNRQRIHLFADSMNSFEGWLNWEIAYAFAIRHRWPRFSFQREYRYSKNALVDIRFHAGPDEQPTALCHLESKLIWRNKNRGKQIKSAARDAWRLGATDAPGRNLLLVVTVSAAERRDWLAEEITRDELLKAVECAVVERIGSVPRMHDLLTLDAPPGRAFYCHPIIRAKLFEL